jgi:hypothetical protein
VVEPAKEQEIRPGEGEETKAGGNKKKKKKKKKKVRAIESSFPS